MADFKKAFEILKKLEYNSCKNALHKNRGEEGYTFMGIYQKAHPRSLIWRELENYKRMLEIYEREPTQEELEELSKLLCNNTHAVGEVERIYKQEYWDKARLDEVQSQKIAEELFIFGVNAGIKRSIKLAQEIVGVNPDGVVGPKTLTALNSFNGNLFDILFDAGEAKYYESLVRANKKFARFERGWLQRARTV